MTDQTDGGRRVDREQVLPLEGILRGSLAPGWHCSLDDGVGGIFPLMGCRRELVIMMYLVVVMV